VRTLAVVTTCNRSGYEQYGRRMVETFDRFWPKDVKLFLYAEGFRPDRPSERIIPVDLLEACPGLVAFKERHRDRPRAHGKEQQGVRLRLEVRRHKQERWPRYKLKLLRVPWGMGYRWDAVRFSHKSFAVFDARLRCAADILCWLDGDTVVFDNLPRRFLEELLPPKYLLSCLKRPTFSECGFVAYNLRHPRIGDFFTEFERLYTSDALFTEKEYHDSWLFDVVRKRFERRGCQTFDIAGGQGATAGHVFINSPLGRYMDHLKGDRSTVGASRPTDLIAPRSEPYWRLVTGTSPQASPMPAFALSQRTTSPAVGLIAPASGGSRLQVVTASPGRGPARPHSGSDGGESS
jgi:hypothetical protein